MTKKKCIKWLLICFVYNYIINNYYRSYIYDNKINDFGITDMGNNLTFIPGTYLLSYLIFKKFTFSKYKDIIMHFGILSTLEILSAFIPHIGTFDPKDIVGLFIGALLLFFLIKNDKKNLCDI